MGLAPIAQVAGEASASAALHELADEMKRARDTGRMIQDLPQAQIDSDYLVRDRIPVDDDDMRVLMSSIAARGQQTPIEVVSLEQGRYGLISGWRRLTALRRLLAQTGDNKFATVQAILRQPRAAADAYVAMVEENEIRVGLSYYERARVAAKAVEQGVYDTEKAALLALFSTASRAKRSKIRSFLPLYHGFDDVLRFPNAIPERLGLILSKALQSSPRRIDHLRDGLAQTAPNTPEAELACLESLLSDPGKKQALKPTSEPKSSDPLTPKPGIVLTQTGRGKRQSLTLSGPAVTDEFRDRLLAWIAAS